MFDANVSTEFPDPPLPSFDSEGRPVPPWEKYPNLRRSSMGWRMGAGESFLVETFHPWWSKLGEAERVRYRLAHPEPDEWNGFLGPADFDLEGRMVPPWVKYTSRPQSDPFWRTSGRRYLNKFGTWWDALTIEKQDIYRAFYSEPEEWRHFLS